MFDRLIGLIGKDNLNKLSKVNIALIGVGGVGGFTIEALIRSGIKNITIIDGDVIDITNLNRQIIALNDNIKESKVNVALKRAKSINPYINITGINAYINAENVNQLHNFDYVIDACDDLSAKIAMIKYCTKNNIKIVCALGTGKRLNPEGIRITKLNKTKNDPLAKRLRQRLKKENISLDIPVIYHENIPLNNDKVISSSIFPPAVAGIYLAYYIINNIINS